MARRICAAVEATGKRTRCARRRIAAAALSLAAKFLSDDEAPQFYRLAVVVDGGNGKDLTRAERFVMTKLGWVIPGGVVPDPEAGPDELDCSPTPCRDDE